MRTLAEQKELQARFNAAINDESVAKDSRAFITLKIDVENVEAVDYPQLLEWAEQSVFMFETLRDQYLLRSDDIETVNAHLAKVKGK